MFRHHPLMFYLLYFADVQHVLKKTYHYKVIYIFLFKTYLIENIIQARLTLVLRNEISYYLTYITSMKVAHASMVR